MNLLISYNNILNNFLSSRLQIENKTALNPQFLNLPIFKLLPPSKAPQAHLTLNTKPFTKTTMLKQFKSS
jgi:hypothetical protein